MSNEINRAVAALFPQGGDSVADIKFFPGTKSGASAEEFAEEVLRADAQVRTGAAVRSETLDSELTN
jgi:hypothetical protein